MAIAISQQGSFAATETSGAALSPTAPGTVNAGDILIAHVYFEGTADAPLTPSGWTLLSGPHVIESTISRMWVFGKIADGTEDSGALVFGSPAITTMRAARSWTFTGRVSGTITDCVRGFAFLSHATDPQMPTVTTTVAGGLAVAFVAQNDNNALAAATGATGGTWTEPFPEAVAVLTPGLVIQVQTCTPTADPGTVSGGAVAATNDPSGVVAYEIRPNPPVAGTTVSPASIVHTRGTSSPVVNTSAKPASLVHTRAQGAPKVSPTISPVSLSHTRGQGAVTVSLGTSVSPEGLVHTRGQGNPVVNTTVLPTGLVHTRAQGSVTLKVTVFPSSIVHTRAQGSLTIEGGAPPDSEDRQRRMRGFGL